MTARLKIGHRGETDALVEALAPIVDLTPLGADAIDGLHAVLITGPDAQLDAGLLADVFAAGLKVGVSRVSPEIRAALTELSGIQPLGESALDVYRPALDGGGIELRAALSPSGAIAEVSDGASMSAPAVVDARLLAALFDAPAILPPRAAAGGENFRPSRTGVAYGHKSSDFSLTGAIAQPSGCDRHINDERRTTPQSFGGRIRVDFHCYWVDGDRTPHFIVLAKQTVDFHPAISGHIQPQNTWCWDGNSLGFILFALDYEPTVLTASGATKVTLDSWAPQTDFQNGQMLGFGREMALRCHDAAGARSDIISFNAACDQPNVFDGWGCKPRVDAVGQKAAWRFHQAKTWNPTTEDPYDFGRWWREIYKYHPERDGLIRTDWPEQSRRPLHTTAISAWRVDCLSKPGPKGAPIPAQPVSIQLSGSVWARNAFFHNTNGCTKGRHHLFLADYGAGFKAEAQLDALCQPL